MPLLSCAERRNLYAFLTERPPYLMGEGVQRLAHMPPKRRRRIRDLLGELLVDAGDVLPKVKAREDPCSSRPADSSRSRPPRLRRARDGHG